MVRSLRLTLLLFALVGGALRAEPSDPSGVQGEAYSDRAIRLTWTPGAGAAAYRISYRPSDAPPASPSALADQCAAGGDTVQIASSLVGAKTEYIVRGLTPATYYAFKVCSENGADVSTGASPAAQIATLAPRQNNICTTGNLEDAGSVCVVNDDIILPDSGPGRDIWGQNLRIAPGGRIRKATPGEPFTIRLEGDLTVEGRISGNVAVDARNIDVSGTFDADAVGYAGGLPETAGSGPGGGPAGIVGSATGGGASYAGEAGFGSSGTSGATAIYGDFEYPTDYGSGGGGAPGAIGGAGGGYLLLVASDTIHVTGIVRSNGGRGDQPFGFSCVGSAGGGSGGSIRLMADKITGTGAVSASGGEPAGWWCDGGAGSGGRVLAQAREILFPSDGFSARSGGDRPGGAGTIYVRLGTDPGTLIFDNDRAGSFAGSSPLDLSANRTIGKLVVRDGAKVIPFFSGLPYVQNLVVQSALVDTWGLLTASPGGAGGAPKQAGTAAADALGFVDPLRAGQYGVVGANSGAGGGGHAGDGGMGQVYYRFADGGRGGYGNFFESLTSGSGGAGADVTRGGDGGGALWLKVLGEMEIKGEVSVAGGDSNGNWWDGYGGGGAGGSIHLEVGSLKGAYEEGSSRGALSANGGYPSGGAGYITVVYDTLDPWLGKFLTAGGQGRSGAGTGGAGLVYLAPRSGASELIASNGLLYGGASALTPIDLSLEGEIGKISILLGAHVRLTGAPALPQRLHILAMLVDVRSGISADGLGEKGGAAFPDCTLTNDGIPCHGEGGVAGAGGGRGSLVDNETGAGGGHGGHGGTGCAAGACSAGGPAGGVAFGSELAPRDLGGGGGGGDGAVGGNGGGAIELTVDGTLTLDGTLTSHGANGSGSGRNASGGGAGGSIFLKVVHLTSTSADYGDIGADGGYPNGNAGGGAGGRIALYFQETSVFNLNDRVHARGAYGSNDRAEDGSVRLLVDLPECGPTNPRIALIEYDDSELHDSPLPGDAFVFHFTEPMDRTTLTDGTIEANVRLYPGGKKYGDINKIKWIDDQTVRVEVTFLSDPDNKTLDTNRLVHGDEWVIPAPQLVDKNGLPVCQAERLTRSDTVPPKILRHTEYIDEGSGNPVIRVQFQTRIGYPPNFYFYNGYSGDPVSVSFNGDQSNSTYIGDTFAIEVYDYDIEAFKDPSSPGSPAIIRVMVSDAVDRHGNVMTPETFEFSSFASQPGAITFLAPIVADQFYATRDPVHLSGTRPDNTEIRLLARGQGPCTDPDGNLGGGGYGGGYGGGSGGTDPYSSDCEANRGTVLAAIGSGDWEATISLRDLYQPDGLGNNDGTYALYVVAVGADGIPSAHSVAYVTVDTTAPTLTVNENGLHVYGYAQGIKGATSHPESGEIGIRVYENGAGVDQDKSSVVVKTVPALTPVAGSVSYDEGSRQFTFFPDGEMPDGEYEISAKVTDRVGYDTDTLGYYANNQTTFRFVVDRVAPAAAAFNPVPPERTNIRNLTTLTGLVESNAKVSVSLNGNSTYAYFVYGPSETAGLDAFQMRYSTLKLEEGENTIELSVNDQAGNPGPSATAKVTLVVTPPSPVTINSIKGDPVGTNAKLDWFGYNETANSNKVGYYTVFQSDSQFTDASADLKVSPTVKAGTFNREITGLTPGKDYYFAVVATDELGLENLKGVTTYKFTPQDTRAPEDPKNLIVTPGATSLALSWGASKDSDSDLKDYRVYVDGSLAKTVAKDTLTATIEGLQEAQTYALKIASVDTHGNESKGLTGNGTTFLPNPGGVTATPGDGRLEIGWNTATSSPALKNYKVYVETTDFSTVQGLTAKSVLAPSKLADSVGGLTNKTPYYVAVTSVNTDGGERPEVTTKSATPVVDATGPTLDTVKFDTKEFASSLSIQQSGKISVVAKDPSGVSRVEFYLSEGPLDPGATPFGTDTTATSNVYDSVLDVGPLKNVTYLLTIKGLDTKQNASFATRSITVTPNPPRAPVFTSPSKNIVSNATSLELQGTLPDPATAVYIFRNGTKLSDPVVLTPDKDGFRALVDLQLGANGTAGTNAFRAQAENAAGLGAQSAEVVVLRDPSVPAAPTSFTAAAQPGGKIKLQWSSVSGLETKYDVYRSEAAFSDTADATKIAEALTVTTKEDLPPLGDPSPKAGKHFFYAVQAINRLGTRGPLSERVEAIADATGPDVASVQVETTGYTVPVNRFGAGVMTVRLRFDEPLGASPFVSLVTDSGAPVILTMSESGEGEYKGTFNHNASVKSGTTYVTYSARDLAGNKGARTLDAPVLLLDAQPPVVREVTLLPSAPLKIILPEPAPIQVGLQFSENVDLTKGVSVWCDIDGKTPSKTAASQVDPQPPGQSKIFLAKCELPVTAGAGENDSLSIRVQAYDGYGNKGATVEGDNRFAVYQSDLPPLAAPLIAAKALSGGKAELLWKAVPEAAGYEVFHQGPGEAALTSYLRLDPTTTVTLPVTGAFADGEHLFSLKTIRSKNGDESKSALGNIVTVSTAAQAPEPPILAPLELRGSGIYATWSPSPGTQLRYRLYRSAGTITSVADATPISGPQSAREALDTRPSSTDFYYAVTVVDAVGNESAPSNSEFLNAGLLPPTNLVVEQKGTSAPSLSWDDPSKSVSGYRLRLLSPIDPARQLALLADPAKSPFVDSAVSFDTQGLIGEDRLYSVESFDSKSSSPGHSILLPRVGVTVADGTTLKRGQMNRVTLRATHKGAVPVANARLRVEAAGQVNVSEPFALAIGETKNLDVVLAGSLDLPDSADIQTTFENVPDEGTVSRLVRTHVVPTVEERIQLSLSVVSATRNGLLRARFTAINTSAVETDLVTAVDGGYFDSEDISLDLLGGENGVLATTRFKQTRGAGLLVTPSGRTVVRLAPGAQFTSDVIEMALPQNAPQNVTLRLKVAKLHYHLDAPDTQSLVVNQTAVLATELRDARYLASVDPVSPDASFGRDEIQIKGFVVDMENERFEEVSDLLVFVHQSGYEFSAPVQTASDGRFSYTYQPAANAKGVFQVSVVPPELKPQRPAQRSFSIGRVVADPAEFLAPSKSLSLPRGVPVTIPVTLSTLVGSVSDVKIVFVRPESTGTDIPGLRIAPPTSSIALAEGLPVQVPIVMEATDVVADTGHFELAVKAGDETVAILPVDYQVTEATPSIRFTPSFAEIGTNPGSTEVQSIVVKNEGLADLTGARFRIAPSGGYGDAPSWVRVFGVKVGSPQTIAAGASLVVDISVSPPAETPESRFDFDLVVEADTLRNAIRVPIVLRVSPSGTGDLVVHVIDMYTGGLDAKTGQPILGVLGAKVKLRPESNPTQITEVSTDVTGEVRVNDLPAGRYFVRVSASGRQDYSGYVTVQPATTRFEEILLEHRLVTVEWSIQDVTIQDRYDIVLNLTFSTDVPAPVIVHDPPILQMLPMIAGETETRQIRITNYGLIRVEDFAVGVPVDDAYFKYEMLATPPSVLESKQSFLLPIKITARKTTLENDSETGPGASGGNCYAAAIASSGRYQCQAGRTGSTSGGTSVVCKSCSSGGSCVWKPNAPPGGLGQWGFAGAPAGPAGPIECIGSCYGGGK